MLTACIALFAVLSISGLVIMLVAARRAPVGFEDEAGFHAVAPRSSPGTILGATLSVG